MTPLEVDRIADHAAAAASALGSEFLAGIERVLRRYSWRQLATNPTIIVPDVTRIIDATASPIEQGLVDALLAGYLHGGFSAIADLPPLEPGASFDAFLDQVTGQGFWKGMPGAGFQVVGAGLPKASTIATAAGGAKPPKNPLRLVYPNGEQPLIEFPLIRNAITHLSKQQAVTPERYYELSADAKSQAFTIGGGLRDAAVEKIHDILTDVAKTTTSRQDFEDRVKEEFGKLPVGEAHLEQVFRNNVHQAYSDGVEEIAQQPLIVDAFPYRAYYAIHDSRVRAEHIALESAGLNGTNIYHRLDPVWQLFRPPWDWNCRCGFVAMTVRDAARQGVAEAIEWLNTGIEPVHYAVPDPGFRPDPEWRRVAA